MSRIPELGKNLQHLPNVLAEYEDRLAEVEKNLAIKGKTIVEANREQASWMSYYDQARIELSSIVKFVEKRVEAKRGELFKFYTENHSIALTDRAKDKYIDSEDSYLTMNELYLEVRELHEKFAAVVDAFKARGYALNNITKLHVVSMEDIAL